jgi:hypothetical protein
MSLRLREQQQLEKKLSGCCYSIMQHGLFDIDVISEAPSFYGRPQQMCLCTHLRRVVPGLSMHDKAWLMCGVASGAGLVFREAQQQQRCVFVCRMKVCFHIMYYVQAVGVGWCCPGV